LQDGNCGAITILALHNEPATFISILDVVLKTLPALIQRANKLDNSSSTFEGVAFDARKPPPEVQVALVIIALSSQLQFVDTVSWIAVTLIIGVIIQTIAGAIGRNPKTGEMVLFTGCHRRYDVCRTYVNDVGVTMDMIVRRTEVNCGHCLAFEKLKLWLLHCNCIVLGIVKCEVADLKKS